MQENTVVTGWKRFTEKLKSMVTPDEKRKSHSPTAGFAQGNGPQVDRLEESGGGRSGNRRVM